MRSSEVMRRSTTNDPTPVTNQNLGANQCAYIAAGDATHPPQMPTITAQIVGATATWQLSTTFSYYLKDITRGIPYENVEIESSPKNPSSVPATSMMTWSPTTFQNDYGEMLGGNSRIDWTYTPSGGTTQYGSFPFAICGENPQITDATTLLSALRPANTPYTQAYWFAPRIANHESGMKQFYAGGDGGQPGDPKYGYPAGYGMMQLDPVVPYFDPIGAMNAIWNWNTNVTNALNLMDSRPYGYRRWLSDVRLWQNSGSAAPEPVEVVQYPPVTPGSPNPTAQLSCSFRALDPNTGQPLVPNPNNTSSQPFITTWYADANIMKANGGGSPYITGNGKAWAQRKASNNGENHNFAYEFCTCMNATSQCQKHTTDNGQVPVGLPGGTGNYLSGYLTP